MQSEYLFFINTSQLGTCWEGGWRLNRGNTLYGRLCLTIRGAMKLYIEQFIPFIIAKQVFDLQCLPDLHFIIQV